MFLGVTAKKMLGGFFAGGTGFIQKFHKREIYLIGENFVGKKFSLREIFVTQPNIPHFSPTKSFSSDMMNIFDLR